MNAVKPVSATCASGTHCSCSASQIAFGYLIVVYDMSGIEAIAFVTAGFIRTVTENHALAATVSAMTSRR